MTGTSERVEATFDKAISDLVNGVLSDSLKGLWLQLFQSETSFNCLPTLTISSGVVLIIDFVDIIQKTKDTLIDEKPKFYWRQMADLALRFLIRQETISNGKDDEYDYQGQEDHQVNISNCQHCH